MSASEYDSAKRAWEAAGLSPLWESSVAFKEKGGAPTALFWKWSTLKPAIDDAIRLVSPAGVERRVLMLTDPELSAGRRATTTKGLNAGLQILLPGETARPHRHSMDAIRFVLDGEGAVTIVDGKECPMGQGDLVLTPGWSWHEHVHRGTKPIVWLDGLNSPLHRYLGTAVFEAGPPRELPNAIPDAAFAVAGLVPTTEDIARYSPVFRYSYADACKAVAAAPKSRDGSRRVRYANPLTGGAAMSLMDHQLMQLDAGAATLPFRSTANAICVCVEGEGQSRIGDQNFVWGPKDIFTLPQGNWIGHRAHALSRLFLYSDREVFARLGLLKDEYGNAAP